MEEFITCVSYFCESCLNFITTEENIQNNLKKEQKIVKQVEIKKNERLAFIRMAKAYPKDRRNFIFSSDLQEPSISFIYCKNCNTKIGNYFIQLKKIVGIFDLNLLMKKETQMMKKEKLLIKPNFKLVNKFVLDNLSNFKKIQNISEMVTTYTKDFSRFEIISFAESMEKINLKLNKLEEYK
jgi:hypothetical protein